MTVYEMTPEQRKARRAAIRRQLAAIELTRRRCRELRQQISAIEANSDQAADEHRERTAPILEELDSIRVKQIEEIAAGREPDKALEKRRKQLLEERDESNQTLEEITQRNTALLKPLQRELRSLEKEGVNYLSLQNEIVQHADDADLDRAWLADQKLRWLSARGNEARRRLAELQAGLEAQKENQRPDHALLAVYARRIRRWKLESAEVTHEVAALLAEQERIRSQLLSED